VKKSPTPTSKIPEIDSLYVYKTRLNGLKFTGHLNKVDGYRYTHHKVILRANENEIYDYHRTISMNGVERGLVMITKNPNSKEVQKWFNDQIKKIESDDELFIVFKSAKSTPQELGLYFTY